jgi:hypothetical protein
VETADSSEMSSTSLKSNLVSSQKTKIIIFTASYLSSYRVRQPVDKITHVSNGRMQNPAVDGEIGPREQESCALRGSVCVCGCAVTKHGCNCMRPAKLPHDSAHTDRCLNAECLGSLGNHAHFSSTSSEEFETR